MTDARCRKHCLHSLTPSCRVCCNCGRAVNRAPTPLRMDGGWVPRSEHGPYLFAAQMWRRTMPGYTEAYYQAHPLALAAPHATITGNWP